MKISFIATVFNEESGIASFIDSLERQTKKPDEIIISDGGSSDRTVSILQRLSKPGFSITIVIKKGNRSVGRNEAIRQARGEIIVCTDAGNILDSEWVEKITKPFKDNSIDVVAGYYKAKTKNVFQKCLVPYVLVMPDRLNPDTFLPATRSIAFRKEVWKKIGGFDEKLSHNEDYEFARRIRKLGYTIVVAKDAVVYWIPRDSMKKAYIMFWRFALGDAEARIFRPKVLILFLRYIFGFNLLLLTISSRSMYLVGICILLISLYILWSILKNYRYVNDYRALFFLPLLQFVSDLAILDGTVRGVMRLRT